MGILFWHNFVICRGSTYFLCSYNNYVWNLTLILLFCSFLCKIHFLKHLGDKLEYFSFISLGHSLALFFCKMFKHGSLPSEISWFCLPFPFLSGPSISFVLLSLSCLIWILFKTVPPQYTVLSYKGSLADEWRDYRAQTTPAPQVFLWTLWTTPKFSPSFSCFLSNWFAELSTVSYFGVIKSIRCPIAFYCHAWYRCWYHTALAVSSFISTHPYFVAGEDTSSLILVINVIHWFWSCHL